MVQKYFASNKSSSHKVTFEVDGQLVSPSAATYTLTKNDGSVVGSLSDISLIIPSGATSAVVSLSASANQKTLDYEVRYLTVNFTYASVIYTQRYFYIIRSDLNFPLNAQEVKAVLGAGSSDIPDDYIDIYQAYDEVVADVTETNLATVLSSGSSLFPQVIEAVKFKAALNAGIAMQLSFMQMEQADNTLYRRFEEIDFKSILKRLLDRYNLAVAKLNGVTGTDATNRSFSLIVQGTDPVTGA